MTVFIPFIGYKLSKDLDTFQANTVEPVWQLREDLRYRLSKIETSREQQFCLEDADAVLEQVSNMDFLHFSILGRFVLIVTILSPSLCILGA